MSEDNKHLWDQFCRLGEMMGDGLHHEPDGKWIPKEYKKLAKILLPESKEEKEHKKELAKVRKAELNNKIAEKLKTDKCKCGSELKQSRSGSKVVVCVNCQAKYTYLYKARK